MTDLRKGKLEFDDPAFRRRKPHRVTPGGQVEVDIPALSQSKEIRELVELAGEIVKGDPREDLEARLQELEAERARLAADNQRFREREDHFARALSVADGGQYRADWEGAIRRVLSERDRLAQELAESQEREVERGMLLGRILHEAEAEDGGRRVLTKATLEVIRSALAHPSPAAQAIGRVLEAAVEFCHSSSRGYTGDPELQADFYIRLQDLDEAVDALQALRAGAENATNQPAEPGKET